MMIVFIMPHERSEAIEAYQDRLTAEQIDEITESPDEAIIKLQIDVTVTWITIMEER